MSDQKHEHKPSAPPLPASWEDLTGRQSELEYQEQLRQAMEESRRIFETKKDQDDVKDVSRCENKNLEPVSEPNEKKKVVIKEGHTVMDVGDPNIRVLQSKKGMYVEYLEEELERLREKLKEVYLAVDTLQMKSPQLHQEVFAHISTQFMQGLPDYSPTGFSFDEWPDSRPEPFSETEDEIMGVHDNSDVDASDVRDRVED